MLAMAMALTGCEGDGAAEGPGGAAEASGGGPAITAEGEILAIIGGGGVTVDDFLARAVRTPGTAGGDLSPEARTEIMDALITEEALWQEAMELGLYRDAKVRKIMVNLLLREQIYAKVSASDFAPQQIQTYFDAHQDEFTVPEKIQVKRIFLRVGADRTLEQAMTLGGELRAELLLQPDRFKDLAAEHSDGPYKRRGGDLGYLSSDGKPGIEPEVVAKAFELDVGDISEPFEAANGVNIVAVASRREKVERTFEQMKGSVLRKLKNERYSELQDAYVESIKGKSTVGFDEERLMAIDIEGARKARTGASGEDPGGPPAVPGRPAGPLGDAPVLPDQH
jgi:hypothetical protein